MFLEAAAFLALMCPACEKHDGYPLRMPVVRLGKEFASNQAGPQIDSAVTPPAASLTVDGGKAIRPQMIVRIEPEFPPRALHDSIEGRIVIKFQIAPDGIPFNLTVVQSDNAVFNGPALSALAKSRFAPEPLRNPIYGGRWFHQPYAFRIEDDAATSPAP